MALVFWPTGGEYFGKVDIPFGLVDKEEKETGDVIDGHWRTANLYGNRSSNQA